MNEETERSANNDAAPPQVHRFIPLPRPSEETPPDEEIYDLPFTD